MDQAFDFDHNNPGDGTEAQSGANLHLNHEQTADHLQDTIGQGDSQEKLANNTANPQTGADSVLGTEWDCSFGDNNASNPTTEETTNFDNKDFTVDMNYM